MTTESILVIAPYYLLCLDPEVDIKIVGLSLGISLFITIPTTVLLSRYLANRLKDRAIIVLLLILCILVSCSLFLIHLYETLLIQYIIVSCICLIVCTLLENTTSTMITKIIPGNYEVASSNAGLLINYVTTCGRVIGSLMIYFTSQLNYEKMNIVVYGIIAGLFALIFIITLLFYKDLRVKAIARILRNRVGMNNDS
jgi:predicted MFS family arabinose efflux permease